MPTTHPDDVAVEGFTVENWASRGIVQRRGTGTVHIQDNIVLKDSGTTTNAISISGGTGSTITGNVIESTSLDNADWTGSGISLWGSIDALVENNTISGSDNGVLVLARPDWVGNDPSWDEASGNIIRNNTINEVTYGVFLQANVNDTLIENNDLIDNEDSGIVFGDVGTDYHPQDTEIRGNLIAGNGIGIKFWDGDNNPGDVVIEDNVFEGNEVLLTDATGFIDRDDVLQENQVNALVRYVATDGDDSGNNCLDPAQSCLTIQHALNQAIEFDTVDVAPGTYAEAAGSAETGDSNALIIQTDGITLVSSAGAEETIIDAGGATNAILIGDDAYDPGVPTIHPDEVTVEGFTVENWASRGIVQRRGTGTVHIQDNIVLKDSGTTTNAISISGGTGSTITGNVIESTSLDNADWTGSGISLWGSIDALVENNTISGSDNGVLVIANPGWVGTDPSWEVASGNTIHNNTISGVSSAVILQGNVVETLIESNDLVGNKRGIEVAEAGLDGYPSDINILGNFIAHNETGIVFFDPGNDSGIVAIYDNVFEGNQENLLDWLEAIDDEQFVEDNEFNQVVRLVATDGEDSGNCSEDACQTIQYAVDQAAPGDSISIAAGTYREQVGVGKSLIIDAEPGAVLEAPDTMSVIEFPENSDEWKPMMLVHGGSISGGEIAGSSVVDVDVSGLEFDGRDLAHSERYPAILYRNANGLIANNSIHSMGNLEGNESYGVSVYGDSVVEVVNNHITGYGRGGVGIQGSDGPYPHPDGLVVNNTLVGIGYGEDQPWGANAIQVAWGATGAVMNNTVTGGWHENATVAGVFVGLGSNDVVVADNYLAGNGAGVQVYDASGTEITGNVIEDGDYGMDIGYGNSDTVIDGNEIRNQFLDGILVWTQSTAITNTQITNNLIEMSDWGLTLFVGEPGEIDGIDVTGNEFVDNNRQLVDNSELLDEQDFVVANTFDVTLTLDVTNGLPAGLQSGSGWAGFTAHLTSVGEVPENVVLWIEADGIDDSDYSQGLRVEYFNGSEWESLGWGGASHWQLNRDAFFLGRDENVVSGFPIAGGTDDLIPLRVNWDNDDYPVTATLESTDSGDGSGNPGDRIWLNENYLLDVTSTSEGEVGITLDGVDASGQSLVQGNAAGLVIAVDDVVLPADTELAVVFDGQRPGDASAQPGEGVCADLLGNDDCQALDNAIGFGNLIDEEGSHVLFDDAVSIRADAEPGQWLLRYFLVENEEGDAGTVVHQLDVDITIEAASGQIAGMVEITGIGSPDLPADSLEVTASQAGDVMATDLTDAAGNYSLEGLVGGTYTVTVAALDGFESASTEVTLASSTDTAEQDFLLESTVTGDIAASAGGMTIEGQTFAAGRTIEAVDLDAMRNDGGADLDFYVSLLVFDEQWQEIDYINEGLFTQQTLIELADVLGPDNSFTLGGNDVQNLLADASLELGENADTLGVNVMRFRLIDDRFGERGNRIKHVENNYDVTIAPQDELDVSLGGFEAEYQQGAMETGSEQVVFDYTANAGDIEQVFNVFTVLEGGVEIAPEDYDAIFESVEFVPAQIRGLTGTDASVVTAPGDLGVVSVQFLLEEDAPLGDYEIVITSFDVTGIEPDDVALGDTDTYRVLDTASQALSLIQGPELELTIEGPELLSLTEEGYYDVRLQNTGDAEVGENVEVQFAIARAGIEVGDAVVDYCIDESATSGEDCGEWAELTLTADNGSLSGRFGPAEGFEVDEGYDQTTFIRAAFTEPGNYDASAQAVGVDTEEVYAAGMTEVAISELSFDIAEGVPAGVPDGDEGWAYYTATLVNLGDELPENVALWVAVDGIDDDAKVAGDLEIEYFTGTEWQRLGWAGESSYWWNYGRDAWFLGRPEADPSGEGPHPIEGFPVGAGESFPTPIRINFDNDVYDLTVSVETSDQNADPIWVYGEFEEQIGVVSEAVDLDFEIERGVQAPDQPPRWDYFTATLSNIDGGATPDDIVLYVAVDETDLAAGDALEFWNGSDWQNFGWDAGREAWFLGRDGAGGVSGFPIEAGEVFDIEIRVNFLPDLYEGTITVESFDDSIVGVGGVYGEFVENVEVLPTPADVTFETDDLVQTFDGTEKTVGVTTAPEAELDVEIVFDPASPVDAGSYAITATVVDPYFEGEATETLVIEPAEAQVMLDDLVQVYDGEPKQVTVVTDPAGINVLVTYDGGSIEPVVAGTYAVEAVVDQPNYTGSASDSLTIEPADQVIDFPTIGDRPVDTEPFVISASATSGLPVSFTLVSGPATLDGNEVTLTGELGEVVITADQPGSDNWNAAPTETQSFNVVEGDGNTIEAVSATTISGEAGEPVDVADLPTVRVVDQADNPVAGVTVSFEVTSSGGSISGATQVTDSEGLAQVGEWVLGSEAVQTLTASAPGLAGSPVEFTAEVDAVVNLDISITDNRDTIEPGERNTYVVTVSNAGPNDAEDAEVSVVLPPELVTATADWQCFAGQGASCTGSDSGDIADDAVSMAAGSSVIYVLEADVDVTATGPIAVTATVELDDVVASDTTTTQIVITEDPIFQDRFESDDETDGSVSADASRIEGHLMVSGNYRGGLPPRVLLGGRDRGGNDVFRVRSLAFDQLALVRIELRDTAGHWSHGEWLAMQPAEEGALAFEYDAENGLLILAGDSADDMVQSRSSAPAAHELFTESSDQVEIVIE